MRKDFATIGLFLLVIGLLFAVLAFANDAIVRIIRSSASWFLALAIIAVVGGLIYLLAGVFGQSDIGSSRPVRPPPAEPAAGDVKTEGKTGPGWHCTWCWAPLEEGSKYCNSCGRKID